MDPPNDIEFCLGVVKRFLICPICLDDFKNPLITPCGHVFCTFCIHEHVGRKRHAKCPLCNRQFTRRSLKTSGKVGLIAKACEAILTNYETESGNSVLPNHLPSEQLHLSQELTQRAAVVGSEHLARTQRKTNVELEGDQAYPPPNVRGQAIRASRSRILLGTAARTRRTRAQPGPSSESHVADDLLVTQPMTDSDATDQNVSSTATYLLEQSDDVGDLGDLFAFTQATQPMHTTVDEFTPVEGMFSRTFQSSVRDNKPILSSEATERHLEATSQDKHDKRSRKKGIRTVPFLPPLPPSKSTKDTKFSQTVLGKKKAGNVISTKAVPTTGAEGASEGSSARGYLRKTHEILCHVQPTVINRDLDKEESNNEPVVLGPELETKHIGPVKKLKRQPSASQSVRSWPLKRQKLTLSVEARNRLLQKYGVTRRPVVPVNTPSPLQRPTKSPGWSRWRSMCKDLQRRSSSVRLSFRSKSRASLQLNEPTRSQSVLSLRSAKPVPSVEITPSVRTCNSQHEKRKLTKVNSQSVASKRSRASLSSVADKIKPCKFVIPLRRMFSSKRSRVSLPLCTVPVVQLGQAGTSKPTDDSTSMLGTHVTKSPPLLHPDGNELPFVGDSLLDSLDHTQHVHCSACGETLILHSDSFNAFNSPSSSSVVNRIRTSFLTPHLSCSISSSYWQAEDPGDTLFDQESDKLPCQEKHHATLTHAEKAFCDAGCQTGLSESPEKMEASLLEPVLSADIELLTSQPPASAVSPTASIQSSSAVEATTTIPSTSPVCISPISSVAVREAGSSESPGTLTNVTSTFPASSSELMPTLDRERLRTECNELEAVVAALQQQLEAQAGELSPNTTAELLRAAGTEPMDADEDENEPPLPAVTTTKDDFKLPTLEGTGKEITEPSKALLEEPVEKADQLPIPRFASEFFPSSMIPGTCPSEVIDIIPSSQTEEEMDHLAVTESIKPGTEQPGSSTSRSGSQLSTLVTRVEASQPTSSYTTALIYDLNPPVSIGSQSSQRRLDIAASLDLSQCPETNLESQMNSHSRAAGTNASTALRQQASSKVSPSALVLTGSSLSTPDMILLRSFCKKFGVSEGTQFVPGTTTHVVMKAEADRPRVVKRTLKYFMAILNRAWIVNTDWLQQSLAANRILDETPFEIEGDTVCGDCHEGPRRGRLNVPAQPQPLESGNTNHGPFAGLWLCAYDSLGLLTVADFKKLATGGGATRVFDKPLELASAVEQYLKTQAIHPPRPRAVILTSSDSKGFNMSKCQEIYRIYGFPIISVDWMLNCISLFRRIPISQVYRICPAPHEQPVAPLGTRNPP